jgi:hypothetical protein
LSICSEVVFDKGVVLLLTETASQSPHKEGSVGQSEDKKRTKVDATAQKANSTICSLSAAALKMTHVDFRARESDENLATT